MAQSPSRFLKALDHLDFVLAEFPYEKEVHERIEMLLEHLIVHGFYILIGKRAGEGNVQIVISIDFETVDDPIEAVDLDHGRGGVEGQDQQCSGRR